MTTPGTPRGRKHAARLALGLAFASSFRPTSHLAFRTYNHSTLAVSGPKNGVPSDRLGPGKADARECARDIFLDLGFNLRHGRHVPSTRAIAERGGRLPLYEFLYHASSTAVHFKPDQIMRGIWGERDSMRIDLRQVELTRAIFGTFWSLWLARETLRTAMPISGDNDLPLPSVEALAEVECMLAQVGFPPFIEAGEFRP